LKQPAKQNALMPDRSAYFRGLSTHVILVLVSRSREDVNEDEKGEEGNCTIFDRL
jgi:hypothetical protein